MRPSSYARLPDRFFTRVDPLPVAKPYLIAVNRPLADELQFDLSGRDADALARMFSGNEVPPGVQPIAAAYAGHQFGHFVPQLGDGRAILLGEVQDRGGALRDVQLKGSGRTPYSRGGDGRAALGPVLREYLVSEAMHALGIPSTRALAAVATGESVAREELLPGAILTRVAASHVRVGTFQFFAARADTAAIRLLADYVIARHYPQAALEPRPYLALLEAVIARQAALVASWMNVGFIHGVMNTDNMAISGETIDFGPCAFMDAYDSAAVFSSIDRQGRYAFGNQPLAAQWNLSRFAETLLSLIDPSEEAAVALATPAVSDFMRQFSERFLSGMRSKLGLSRVEAGDAALAENLLASMQRNQADFTLTFRALSSAAADSRADADLRALFANPRECDEWLWLWRARVARDLDDPAARETAMKLVNPGFIPRNHKIEQVIEAAVLRNDYGLFDDMSAVLGRPYADQPEFSAFAQPPAPGERVLQTFCGT